MSRRGWTCAAVALGLATPIAAQTGPAPAAATDAREGAPSYPASFFAHYAPTTALDMVRLVPGFTLDEGDATLRGLAQSAGNVVVDGRRPTTKGVTLSLLLARIPASRVDRIEIRAGDAFGGDYAGKPQVADVVLRRARGTTGRVEAGGQRSFTGRVLPVGSASVTTRRGPATWALSVDASQDDGDQKGVDVVTDPAGNVLETRIKRNRLAVPTYVATATYAGDHGEGRTENASLSVTRALTQLDQVDVDTVTGSPPDLDALVQDYRYTRYEVSLDATRPFAGGSAKVVAIASRRDDDNLDQTRDDVDRGGLAGYRQDAASRSDEQILRATWTRTVSAFDVEAGVEGAHNRLRSDVDLVSSDDRGVVTPIPQPLDHATVAEWRGEAYVNARRAVAPSLTLDVRIAQEVSRLSVVGAPGEEGALKHLSYFKPRASLDWRHGGWALRGSIEREVSQLNFYDFLSTVSLNADTVNGGNADLEPARSWTARGSVDRKLGGDVTFHLEAVRRWTDNVIDRIPVGPGVDSPGNLGAGRYLKVTATLDGTLGAIGLPRLRATISGDTTATSVRDPYTGLRRPYSGISAWHGVATLRWDARRWSAGTTIKAYTPGITYRADSTDALFREYPYVSLFGEWRPDARNAVKLALDGVTDRPSFRRRVFHEPDRSSPDVDSIETRVRHSGVIATLTARRTF